MNAALVDELGEAPNLSSLPEPHPLQEGGVKPALLP